MNHFTRREKIIFPIIALALLIASLVDQQTMNEWELAWLIFLVLPVGIYLITDPDRLGILLNTDR